MHDISYKQIALRTAKATGIIFCSIETVGLIKNNQLPKASLFDMARSAAFIGAKAAPQLLPHCHPVAIDGMEISFEFLEEQMHAPYFDHVVFERSGIVITGEAKSIGRTGVEMEILTAISVAALELYDRLKPVDKSLEIGNIKLIENKGAKGDHKKYFATPPSCAILVCSDSVAAGKREDKSGLLIRNMLQDVNAEVKYYEIVPDDRSIIQRQIKSWVQEDVHFIFTTGGTGLGPRDNTVSAITEILERDAGGITEAMRNYGQMRTPLAMMSRGIAGAIAQTLIITLPGSTGGARESLEAILPAVFHARKMMKGGGH